MGDCCDNCLYLKQSRCICKNSELYEMIIPKPSEECCDCYTPWWQEGYGDYGGIKNG